jgi:prepilin-type N-terminal cleavage/methylation domain-containing protein/prepilin-type processing-associated H-X9-DG protein
MRLNQRFLKAFTLLELVVVVAIIGMLVSLLLPSIQGAMQRGKRIRCIANLNQIGVAVQQYVADPDNGHQFPPIYNVTAANGSIDTKVNSALSGSTPLLPLAALGSYGVTLPLLTCPADTAPDPDYGSYLWSPVLQGEQPQDVHVYTRGGVFSVSKLSSLTLCTDKGRPHLGKLNVLRADGHVETKP